MPELPEVETVRRQLAHSLRGHRFVAVKSAEPAMLADCSEEQLVTGLPGRSIEDVGRLGKFLFMRLGGGGDAYLTVHLGMTGQILVSSAGPSAGVVPTDPPVSRNGVDGGAWQSGSHVRFVFALESPDESPVHLVFRDMRKFGRVHFTIGGPARRLRVLGPDAWAGEWDADYLARRLQKRRASVKAFLLDQRQLAGIGNIYADETLWWTKMAPTRSCNSVERDETIRLADEIRTRLGEGVRLLGCTLADFVDTAGRAGGFQEWLQAYGRQGQPCNRCGETLVRTVIAGRGTVYCPGCQH